MYEHENVEGSISNEKEKDNTLKHDTEIGLLLGDVLQIQSPTNDVLHDRVFLIEYIDPSKIRLVNVEDFSTVILPINPNGVLGDGNIVQIKILSRNQQRGYARQNGLLPGV